MRGRKAVLTREIVDQLVETTKAGAIEVAARVVLDQVEHAVDLVSGKRLVLLLTDSAEALDGEIGEIVFRPRVPFVMMSEYYNMPEKTWEACRNLWFHTGDLAKKDEDGYFYFVDRKKDALRRRGENISSFEVERSINTHPKVLESAAVAVQSELAEDEVKICVVLQPGESLTPEELIIRVAFHGAIEWGIEDRTLYRHATGVIS